MPRTSSVDLKKVAAIYSESSEGPYGGRPTRRVQERLGVTASAARHYVERARAAGLLPPTIKGRSRVDGGPSMAAVGEHRPVRVEVARTTPDARTFYACNACMVVWPCRAADK
jgi:transposase